MIPIMRAATNPKYKRIVPIMSAQMGKTDGLLNVVGHRSDDDPTPIIYVGPTKSFVEKQAEPRLMAMIKSAPSLLDKTAKGKASTKTQKIIAGLPVRLAWAGSATELSSMPAGLGLVDERDRMPNDVGGEGDPVDLVEARGSTYPDFTSLITSTPTVGNVTEKKNPETGLSHWDVADPDDIQSPTWKLWQQGTRHEWAWPCPECSAYFIPRFSLLWWPKDCTPYRALKEARLTCPHCGAQIGSESKNEMNARGVYAAPGQRIEPDGTVIGEPPESDTASFWVSGLCSPWRTFGQRAKAWLEAVRSGDQTHVQTVINTGFGELYRVGGDAPPWENVLELRRPYPRDTVPEGALKLICCVDVQKDRLPYTVRAWGYGLESWLIREGEIYGETEFDAVWSELAQLLSVTFDERPIDLMLIDSGYRPGDRFKRPDNQIYSFARKHRGRVRVTKGQHTLEKPFKASLIDIALGGKVLKKGLQLWHLNTDYFKSFVHSRLEWPAGEPGGWNLYENVTEDYCQQITAEARVVKPSGHFDWIRIRKENHFFDCFDSQTELLTLTGWVPVSCAHEDLEYATVDLGTDEIEYQRPTRIISKHHSGEMVQIKGRRIDALVTPNHRMVVHRYKSGPHITLAKDVDIWDRVKLTAKWNGKNIQSILFNANSPKEPERSVDAADWMEFLGWYVSEGHRFKGNGQHWRVIITQNPGPKQDRILGLMDRLPWKYRITGGRQIVITSRQLFDSLDDCYEPGTSAGCYRKRVPSIVKIASSELISRFIDSAILGDGWVHGKFRTYATTSIRLADDMQELFIKIGNSANIKTRQPPPCIIRGKSYKTVMQYHVSETKTPTATLRRSDNTSIIESIPYDGMVYCVSVPNGTLIARRNGKSMIVGNCEAMSVAGAHMLGIHLLKAPSHMPASRSNTGTAASTGGQPRKRKRIVHSNFMRRN